MLKFAVYDKFYQNSQYSHLGIDIVNQALSSLEQEHEVIGASADMRRAATQIMNFAGLQAAEQPDFVIMGGMLYGEREYRKNPPTVTSPFVVRRRTLLGGIKEETRSHTTYLLPQFSTDGRTYHFPETVRVGHTSANPPQELLQQWEVGLGGIAARVLSRMVETYLPQVKRLGISIDPMIDASLSAKGIDRADPDATEHLRSQILQLTAKS